MPRTSRDLSRNQGLWLAGGCAAFLTVIVGAAVLTTGVASVEDNRARQEQERRTEPRPPAELARVPEVVIESIPPNPNQAKVQLAQLVAKIRAEDVQADGFVKGLQKQRTDLQGLPFQMGGACRMAPAASDMFASAVAVTHAALQAEETTVFGSVESVDRFWSQWGGQDTSAGVAALTQIYGPQTQKRRTSLAAHLKTIDHPASTKALARAAVFDFDSQVRVAAVRGLRGRTREDYTGVLLAGLRHPWPVAAKNAAGAIARLDRQDLVPQLVAFLAEADPRAPYQQDVDGKPVTMVREMVKMNHHRNCLLCHAPAPVNSMPGGVMAVVPAPGTPFPMPEPGNPYGSMPSEAMIRADVTYLRQDFSVLHAVANAHPWPEMQRFDYMVRTRVLTEDEVREHNKQKVAAPVPHHQAAIDALGRLTGKKNVAPTAPAWAAALDLPAPQVVKQ